MSKETVSNPATSTMSAGTPRMSSNSAQAQDRIALRAYALYEQRGRNGNWVAHRVSNHTNRRSNGNPCRPPEEMRP
jgi:hypothetical protein